MAAHPKEFPSRRSAVLATRGMVATSQPLAALEGLRVLMAGGNAADAAVTVAAMLGVVEPMSTGVGGDCFALVYRASLGAGQAGEVFALNGSGRAPAAFTLDEARRLGLRYIPPDSALAVTVPGAVAGWETLLRRFGTMTLADCLAPAIRAAEEGFAVTPVIARDWRNATRKLARDPEAARVYLPAPRAGEIHRQPDLARTLRAIAEGGADAFYRGPIARAIAACIQARGGYMTPEDLAAHTVDWGRPIGTTYRGVQVLEHPPNGQGLAALVALNILAGYDIGGMGYWDAARWHQMIEAVRLGLAEALAHVGDPAFTDVPVERLLSREHADALRARIRPDAALDLAAPVVAASRDTVYISVVDGQGNAVSFINSLFQPFGSGIVVPGTGICLHNRGASFRLREGHPNALAGGKRPYHTIIPALALRDGRLWLCFGVMGAFMQPQGHVQVLVNMVDFGLDPQAALDAPRFRVDEQGGRRVDVETTAPLGLRRALATVGHDVRAAAFGEPSFGGGQVIAVDPETGVLWGGSDPRKDGCAVGW
ncbi:MAG: gamma-glutamyltransferase [Anaerolineales bacterium]